MRLLEVVKKLSNDYLKTTPQRLKIIDAYMLYILLTGIIQFAYCLIVGTFPFNAFLAGFTSTVASFILAGKMVHMKPFSFVKRALTNPTYYQTYAAYGASGFFLAIYFCEWKTVGKYIPLWNARYETSE